MRYLLGRSMERKGREGFLVHQMAASSVCTVDLFRTGMISFASGEEASSSLVLFSLPCRIRFRCAIFRSELEKGSNMVYIIFSLYLFFSPNGSHDISSISFSHSHPMFLNLKVFFLNGKRVHTYVIKFPQALSA